MLRTPWLRYFVIYSIMAEERSQLLFQQSQQSARHWRINFWLHSFHPLSPWSGWFQQDFPGFCFWNIVVKMWNIVHHHLLRSVCSIIYWTQLKYVWREVINCIGNIDDQHCQHKLQLMILELWRSYFHVPSCIHNNNIDFLSSELKQVFRTNRRWTSLNYRCFYFWIINHVRIKKTNFFSINFSSF